MPSGAWAAGAGGEPARRWRSAAVDAAAAALLPVVVLLAPFHAVASANVNDLLYHPSVARGFAAAWLIAWALGVFVLRIRGGAIVARLWVALPWAVLLLDAVGPLFANDDASQAAATSADAAIVLAVVLVAVLSPWRTIRAGAAAAGLVLVVHGVVAHAMFVRDLPPEMFVGPTIPESPPPLPGSDSPGNVYHLLLDAYQSEAFAYSTGATAASRYPGFTYYTRFNTNFPQTSSAEPALIHGRPPTEGMSIADWPATALREGFWTGLAASGVGVWLYPYGRWMCHPRAVQCLTSMDLERDAGATATRDTLIDLWALRVLPDSLERSLARDEDGRTMRFSVTAAVRRVVGSADGASSAHAGVRELPTQYYNLQQFEELLRDEARRPARGQYVYWHGLIPHHDYILDERCRPVVEPKYDVAHYWAFVRCANLMIERLAQRLRELGRFDDALIIVHADHGDPNFLVAPEWMGGEPERALDPIARTYQPLDDSYRGHYEDQILGGDSAKWRSFAVEMLSSGLLLVKSPRATTYAEDARPVQLLDLAPTILAHFGVERRDYPGVPIADVGSEREWSFYAHNRAIAKFSKHVRAAQGWLHDRDISVRE